MCSKLYNYMLPSQRNEKCNIKTLEGMNTSQKQPHYNYYTAQITHSDINRMR